MKVIINGANGRMGRMLTACIENTEGFEIAARVSRSFTLNPEADIYQTLEQFEGEADCVIDFSNHSETGSLLGYCVMRKLPVVIATTGQSAEELHQIETAVDDIPVFLSANMSLGVAVLADLAKRAAAMFPEADIEIIERHHNQKLDAPSGTALLRRSCSMTISSIFSAFASRMGFSSAQSPKTILSPAPKTLAAPKSTGAFSFT